MSKWIGLETTGRCEIKGQLDPLPCGPYIFVHQHDETLFLKEFRTRQIEFTYEFKFKWGYAVYVPTLDGEPMKVAYHYDTTG